MRAARKDDPAHHPDLALPDRLPPQLERPDPELLPPELPPEEGVDEEEDEEEEDEEEEKDCVALVLRAWRARSSALSLDRKISRA